jgi:hypothetical protein
MNVDEIPRPPLLVALGRDIGGLGFPSLFSKVLAILDRQFRIEIAIAIESRI